MTRISSSGVADGPTDAKMVMAFDTWPSNAHLIADVARLGYIRGDVLDCTWGLGNFWTQYRPPAENLIGTDLNISKSPCGFSVDFRDQPWDDQSFDTVAFDPPYKLTGTPDRIITERFGVETMRWQDRMQL